MNRLSGTSMSAGALLLCLCILAFWQATQVRAQAMTSFRIPGQTNFSLTALDVARPLECDSWWNASKAFRRSDCGRNGLTVPVEMSHKMGWPSKLSRCRLRDELCTAAASSVSSCCAKLIASASRAESMEMALTLENASAKPDRSGPRILDSTGSFA